MNDIALMCLQPVKVFPTLGRDLSVQYLKICLEFVSMNPRVTFRFKFKPYLYKKSNLNIHHKAHLILWKSNVTNMPRKTLTNSDNTYFKFLTPIFHT